MSEAQLLELQVIVCPREETKILSFFINPRLRRLFCLENQFPSLTGTQGAPRRTP
jgi:hypothetical protein